MKEQFWTFKEHSEGRNEAFKVRNKWKKCKFADHKLAKGGIEETDRDANIEEEKEKEDKLTPTQVDNWTTKPNNGRNFRI